MLVLDRKDGQAVIVELPSGERLRIISRRHFWMGEAISTKLAFEAPAGIQIWREEIAPRTGNGAD